MEQHFQDVAQKVANNKNSESFAAHFAKHLRKNQVHKNFAKLCLSIFFTVNPIGSMKTWGKLSCTPCMKERIEIIDNSQRRYSRIINAYSEVYRACRHMYANY